MRQLQIKPIQQATFEADAILDDAGIAVRFAGIADLNMKAMMDSFLRATHEEAKRLDVNVVNVDVSGLEFINSSCLMAVVNWITGVKEMARRYQISFHFQSIRDWHRRSFGVLAQLGEGVVSVRIAQPDQRSPEIPSSLETTRMSKPRGS
jgi:ABC-type transporter Mla MlaB component